MSFAKLSFVKLEEIEAVDMKHAEAKVSSTTSTEEANPMSPSNRKPTTKERDIAVRLASASIADAIGLYMRSDTHRHMSFADLEWMLVPALMSNQIKFAYMRPESQDASKDAEEAHLVEKWPPVAVAMITWAKVSSDTVNKLHEQAKAGQLRNKSGEDALSTFTHILARSIPLRG